MPVVNASEALLLLKGSLIARLIIRCLLVPETAPWTTTCVPAASNVCTFLLPHSISSSSRIQKLKRQGWTFFCQNLNLMSLCRFCSQCHTCCSCHGRIDLHNLHGEQTCYKIVQIQSPGLATCGALEATLLTLDLAVVAATGRNSWVLLCQKHMKATLVIGSHGFINLEFLKYIIIHYTVHWNSLWRS